MEITPVTFLLLPLGILSFLFAPRLLYWCAIFFLPFSATAVFNFNRASGATGLQVGMFFGLLWMLKEGISLYEKPGLARAPEFRASMTSLKWFFLALLLSLIMPLYLAGRLDVECPDPGCTEGGPLSLTFRHITQVLYVAYGLGFAALIALKNSDIRQFRKSIGIYLSSCIFVSLWGFVQWYCYSAGLSYPAFLFNNNTNISAQGYLEELRDLGLTRISSVTVEPSILSQVGIIAVVFAGFAVFGNRIVISKFWDKAALVTVTSVLLLSTSSTAYAGLAILLPVSLFGLWYLGRLRLFPVILVAALIVLSYLAYQSSDTIQVIADRMIFSKLEKSSGLGRLYSLYLGSKYFSMYPVLGIGWS